jgi:ketosteroid isomerase-like protein
MADAKTVLQTYVAALLAGDEDTIRSSFAEDAVWRIDAGDLPISGTYEGRDAIIGDFLATALANYDPDSIEIEVTAMVAEGDQVALQWTSRARTATGRPYENGCFALFEVRDGLIVSVREYMDTLYLRDVVYAA